VKGAEEGFHATTRCPPIPIEPFLQPPLPKTEIKTVTAGDFPSSCSAFGLIIPLTLLARADEAIE
jgi:hypothetical protein